MIDRLRVAMIAGTLGAGGAEKQLAYIARGLHNVGVEVCVYSLSEGEVFENWMKNIGIPIKPVGKNKSRILRIAKLLRSIKQQKPHIIYGIHFYTNFYASICGKLLGITSVGSLRSDVSHEINNNPRTAHWLLKMPDAIIANSYRARRNALNHGVAPSKIFILPNVIDLDAFDRQAAVKSWQSPFPGKVMVAIVGRLIKAKRVDRFIDWLAAVREKSQEIVGVVVGDGPLREELLAQSGKLGLIPDGVVFTGHQENIPSLLQNCDILALTSDHEGFPNVLLEAMAADLPIVTLPAGDAARVVVDGVNGFLVREHDRELWAKKILALANSPRLREQMGVAGRQMVSNLYSSDALAVSTLGIFREIFERKKANHLVKLIPIMTTLMSTEEDLPIHAIN